MRGGKNLPLPFGFNRVNLEIAKRGYNNVILLNKDNPNFDSTREVSEKNQANAHNGSPKHG